MKCEPDLVNRETGLVKREADLVNREIGLVNRDTDTVKWIFMYTKHAVFTHGVLTQTAPHIHHVKQAYIYSAYEHIYTCLTDSTCSSAELAVLSHILRLSVLGQQIYISFSTREVHGA